MMSLRYIYDPDVHRLIRNVVQPPPELLAGPIFQEDSRGIILYHGDALNLFSRVEPETCDLIIADPPYFLSSGGITCKNGKMVCVDKGAWDKPLSLESMHNFNVAWLTECRRVLKPHGSIWVSGTMHNIFSVGFALQSLRYKILNDIAWHKVNPPINLSGRYFTHATETLIWARRDRKSQHIFHHEIMKNENHNRQMPSLWHIKPPQQWEKRHGNHPTQKPEALIERILQASSSVGDTVLDPFAGSGTTGAACARLGRRYIGFEQEHDYNKIAIKRLADECVQPPSKTNTA